MSATASVSESGSAERLAAPAVWHLLTATGTQTLFMATALAIAAGGGDSPAQDVRYALIALLAVGMGIQDAAARKLAVPDLTMTVLKLTLTGIASDSRLAGGEGAGIGWRGLP